MARCGCSPWKRAWTDPACPTPSDGLREPDADAGLDGVGWDEPGKGGTFAGWKCGAGFFDFFREQHGYELRERIIDLDDGEVQGGIQKNLGLALNWYPRSNLRAQFNLIYYDAERDTGDETGWIAQTRVQLSW